MLTSNSSLSNTSWDLFCPTCFPDCTAIHCSALAWRKHFKGLLWLTFILFFISLTSFCVYWFTALCSRSLFSLYFLSIDFNFDIRCPLLSLQSNSHPVYPVLSPISHCCIWWWFLFLVDTNERIFHTKYETFFWSSLSFLNGSITSTRRR